MEQSSGKNTSNTSNGGNYVPAEDADAVEIIEPSAESRGESSEPTPSSNTATQNAGTTGGALVTRDAFLARAKGKDARPVHRVELPWIGAGMHVFVRGMGARQRDVFEDAITSIKNDQVIVTNDNVRARVIVQCACDANGTRIFKDGDEPVVGELDARTADAIYAKAAKLSGITKADVDELVKN